MEKVAHGVDENASRLPPVKRGGEGLGVFAHDAIPDRSAPDAQGQSGVLVHSHGLKPGSHLHCVAV